MKKFILFFGLLVTSFVYAQSPTFEWADALSGAANEQGSRLVVDPAGNVYTVGTFQSTVDFDPGTATLNLNSAGDYDIFITKMDWNGNLVWAKSFGGTGTDYGYGIDIDAVGNIYITGMFSATVDFDPNAGVSNMTSFGDGDVYICKFTGGGDLVYAKQFGGPYLDEGHSVVVDPNGNVYGTGDFDIIADFDPTASTYNLNGMSCTNLFVVKLSTDGNMLWAKNTSGATQGFDIAYDPAGYVVTTGPFYNTIDFDPSGATDCITSFATADIFLWKLDANGNHVWAKQMGSADASGWDCGNALTIDASGNIYSTGYFIGTGDFDPSAAVYNLTAGNYDAYISKLDANGDFVWAKAIGGFNAQRGFSIDVDAAGNVYTAGDFLDVTDFDPGAGTFTIASTWSANSIFLSKLDPSGNFIWAEQIGNNGIGMCVKVDPAMNIYLSGVYYYMSADFDPGPGVYTLTAVGGNDGLVYKMSQATAGLEETTWENKITTYPNPTVQQVNIESEFEILSLHLVNNAGELVNCTIEKNMYNAKIDISNLANGVYFLQLETAKGEVTKQIVKQ